MKVLIDFFSKLEKESWSGEVDVTSSQGHATIVIKEGQFLMAHRPLDRIIERFEKIPWMKMPPRERLQHFKSWEGLLSEVIASNQESYLRMIQHVKLDRLELFYRIFFWTNVEMTPRAYDVQMPDPTTYGFLSLKRISNLLKEAKRRLEEWPKIQEKIGSSRRIFISQVQLPPQSLKEMDEIDRSIEEFKDKTTSGLSLRSLPYTLEQMEILKLCDGRNSVQDIIRASVDGEFLTLRRMVDLWRSGAIRPKDDEIADTAFKVSWPMFRFRDFIWATSIAGIAFSLALLTKNSVPQTVDRPHAWEVTQMHQALNLYRKSHGSYPLSLTEVAKSKVVTSPMRWDVFRYALIQPQIYELREKSGP